MYNKEYLEELSNLKSQNRELFGMEGKLHTWISTAAFCGDITLCHSMHNKKIKHQTAKQLNINLKKYTCINVQRQRLPYEVIQE